MMAPAMTTRSDERLQYLELARQGARVERSVQADGFSRLAEIAPVGDVVQVDVSFAIRDDGRVWACGSAQATLNAECQRCLERLDYALKVTFDLCIVRDPQLASELASDVDVLVVEGDSLDIAQIVEDEVILGLPERLCVEEPCPLAPSFNYPAESGEQAASDDNPFRVLSVLKR
jgi:uncharacterized protein